MKCKYTFETELISFFVLLLYIIFYSNFPIPQKLVTNIIILT